jgi:SNF2 family DNA or RNA helicase
MTSQPRFSASDRVRMSTDPGRTGTVISGGQALAGTFYYQVIFVGEVEPSLYREVDLQLLETDPNNPVSWLLEQPLAEANAFGEYLTVLKLSSRLSDVLYSFLSSRTVFRVYQFKPVLKLLNSPYQRILIADEVGLGKTIEAGLIWSELDARMDMDRILVVCPAGLRRKWQIELERRFDREVPIIQSPTQLADLLERYVRQGSRSRFAAVAGMEMLRQRGTLETLREVSPSLDLVIVDEAHHLRNRGTLSFELGEFLSEATDYMVFLTATPLNLGTPDLFNLLHLLVPEEFDDFQVFDSSIEPNQWINQGMRALTAVYPPDREVALNTLRLVEVTSQAERFTRNPFYQDVIAKLQSSELLERKDIVDLQRKITELNTLAWVYNRTRKRELAERLAVRRPVTLTVDWTEQEWGFYQAVTAYVRSRFRHLQRAGSAIGWATIMPQRQAASCLPAVRDLFLDLVATGRIAADLDEGEEEVLEGRTSEDRPVRTEIDAVAELIAQAEALGNVDTKFDALADHLDETLTSDPDAQVLMFSFFKRTLAYLLRRLRERGLTVEKMDGDTPRPDRDRLIEQFREGAFQILLSSEVGAEGLDFEFVQYMFNYDLPWNPMRLEQRIGRLDRFGQKHNVIFIGNLHISGTIDSDIFERLYERIGIFERSIGELEPILGSAVKELQAVLLSPELSLEEQQAEADRIALALESKRAALEEFENTRERLVGHDDYVVEQLAEVDRERRYITSDELKRLFTGFLGRIGGRHHLKQDARDPTIYYFTANPQFASTMRAHMRQPTPETNDLLTQLEASTGVTITFDPETAFKKQTEFINFRHPFIEAILHFYRTEDVLHRGGQLEITGPRSGDFLFFIFELRATGLVPQHRLAAIACDLATADVDEEISSLVLPAISQAVARDPVSRPVLIPELVRRCYEACLEVAASQRDGLEAELKRSNEALAVARQVSLQQSLEVRLGRIKNAVSTVRDERILRMRTAQARNLESKVRAKLSTLEQQKAVTVSLRMLAGGFLSTSLEPG